MDKVIGKFQEFKHPDNAEQYDLYEFIKTEQITKFSKILKRFMSQTEQIFFCPRCEDKKDYIPEHGDAYECKECGLKHQTYGRAIFVW